MSFIQRKKKSIINLIKVKHIIKIFKNKIFITIYYNTEYCYYLINIILLRQNI